jgi:hypothetical protein
MRVQEGVKVVAIAVAPKEDEEAVEINENGEATVQEAETNAEPIESTETL